MTDYEQYIETIRSTIGQVRQRLAQDATKAPSLFGLPAGISKSTAEKYLTDFENVLYESIYIHAFSKLESDLFKDLNSAIQNATVSLKPGFSPKYLVEKDDLIKKPADINSLSQLLSTVKVRRSDDISTLKKLRDYSAHGKRFPKVKEINSVDLPTDISKMIREMSV